MLEGGADPNTATADGTLPLFWSVTNGHETVAQVLVCGGAVVNAAVGDGQTSLHAAAARGLADTAELLVDHGADPGAATPTGATPLHAAAEGDHAAVVDTLIRAGADPNAAMFNGIGSRCLMHALSLPPAWLIVVYALTHPLSILFHFPPGRPGATALHLAAINNGAASLALLLAAGAGPG